MGSLFYNVVYKMKNCDLLVGFKTRKTSILNKRSELSFYQDNKRFFLGKNLTGSNPTNQL